MLCAVRGSLFLLCVLPLLAASPEQAVMEQVRPEAIRAHMRFLADDALEGRGTGTRGYDLAARYIAAQFESYGLEPAGVDHTYFQPVPLRRIEPVPEHSSLAIVRDGHEEALTLGKDFAVPGSAVYPETSVRAPAVFVGFGVSAPALGYDDYAGVDVHGKIVVMLSGAPPTFPSAERAHYSGITKTQQAVAHGAVGMITLWAGTINERFPFPHLVHHYQSPGYRWLDAQGRPNDSYPEIRGSAVLSPDASRSLLAGAPKSLDQVLRDSSSSKPQSFALPVEFSLHMVTRHINVTSPHVVALLRGSDPKLRNQYVIYTAHADHMGIGPAIDGDSIYNGAVDNASGTAAMLEVARAFTRLPQPPRRSILFVAVTGEEAGLVGSGYFANNPTVPREQMAANINMDEIPILYDFRDIVALGEEHSSLGPIVREAARRMDLQVSPDPMPEESFFIRSDQYSFVRQGVPAVMISAGLQAADPGVDGKKISMDWEAKLYHTPKDDMNQPLNFQAAARAVRLQFLVGYLTANAAQRPAWNPGDFFGKTFAR